MLGTSPTHEVHFSLTTTVKLDEIVSAIAHSGVQVYRGTGHLHIMGLRNVSFEVKYLIQSFRTGVGSAVPCRWKISSLEDRIGRQLPSGVYRLNEVPGCRLRHFGGKWDAYDVGTSR